MDDSRNLKVPLLESCRKDSDLEAIPDCVSKTLVSDLKSATIDVQSWKTLSESRDSWNVAVQSGTKQGEEDRTVCLRRKIATRKSSSTDQTATVHTCRFCGKDCHSRIGLNSHTSRCSNQNWSPKTEGDDVYLHSQVSSVFFRSRKSKFISKFVTFFSPACRKQSLKINTYIKKMK